MIYIPFYQNTGASNLQDEVGKLSRRVSRSNRRDFGLVAVILISLHIGYILVL